MPRRKWAGKGPLIERVLEWQPGVLDKEEVQGLWTVGRQGLQSFAARLGRTLWKFREDRELLQVLGSLLAEQSDVRNGADPLDRARAAYAVVGNALVQALLNDEGEPWLLQSRLRDMVDLVIDVGGNVPSAVDSIFVGSFLKPLTQADDPRGARRVLRDDLAALTSSVGRLDAAALNGLLPDQRTVPVYQELQALQIMLGAVLREVAGSSTRTMPDGAVMRR